MSEYCSMIIVNSKSKFKNIQNSNCTIFIQKTNRFWSTNSSESINHEANNIFVEK